MVWDIQQKLGLNKEKTVSKERWYIEGDSQMFDDLKEPLVELMTNFLPYDKRMVNGVEALLRTAKEAAIQAERCTAFGTDIWSNLNEFVLGALAEAGKLWKTAWDSKSAMLPCPQELLPQSTKMRVLLDRSLEASRAWVAQQQGCPTFAAAMARVMQMGT